MEGEEEVFEISDYSTATAWEKLVLGLEQQLNKWFRTGDEQTKKGMKQDMKLSSTFSHNNEEFILTYHDVTCGLPDPKHANELHRQILSENFDFPSTKYHHLTRWFGLKRFLLIETTRNVDLPTDVSAMLQGALHLAAVSAGLGAIPAFVTESVEKLDRSALHRGYAINRGCCTKFHGERQASPPALCADMSGLIDLFRLNVGLRTPITREGIRISARFTYITEGYNDWKWDTLMKQEHNNAWTPRRDLSSPYSSGNKTEPGQDVPCVQMKWGPIVDPVDCIRTYCIWSAFKEGTKVDNRIYSELDPLRPPKVHLRLAIQDQLGGQLSDVIREFIDVYLLSLLSHWSNQFDCQKTQQAATPTGTPTTTTNNNNNLSTPVLSDWGLDPEAVLVSPLHKKRQQEASTHKKAVATMIEQVVAPLPDEHEAPQNLEALAKAVFYPGLRMPTAATDTVSDTRSSVIRYPPNSGLALLSYQASHFTSGSDIQQLWNHFSGCVQATWDEGGSLLPHVQHGNPDWATNLAHQKLQMINCCLQQHHQPGEGRGGKGGWDDSLEDELFDTRSQSSDDEEWDEWHDPTDPNSQPPEEEMSKRKGYIKQLLGSDGKPAAMFHSPEKTIWIPLTFPAPPMTEDRAAQQLDAMSGLGSTQVAQKTRASIQSNSLRSDMAAFKAANPFKPSLVDFVRWHSPKDYIPPPPPPPQSPLAPTPRAPPSKEPTPEGKELSTTTKEDEDKGKDKPESAQEPANSSTTTATATDTDEKPCPEGGQKKEKEDTDIIEIEMRSIHKEITEEDCLSVRFREGGNNLWQTVWNTTSACPVSEQKQKLWNSIEEANAALAYFQQISTVEVVQLLLHHFIVLGYWTLYNSIPCSCIHWLSNELQSLEKVITSVLQTQQSTIPTNDDGLPTNQYQKIADEVERVERLLAVGLSLLDRLDPHIDADRPVAYKLVSRLMDAHTKEMDLQLTEEEWALINRSLLLDPSSPLPSTPASTGPTSSQKRTTLRAGQIRLRSPDAREFVLRCTAERPPYHITSNQVVNASFAISQQKKYKGASYCESGEEASRWHGTEECAHRMYALLAKHEFRVQMALSEVMV